MIASVAAAISASAAERPEARVELMTAELTLALAFFLSTATAVCMEASAATALVAVAATALWTAALFDSAALAAAVGMLTV